MSEQTGRGQGHQTSARVIGQSTREEGIERAGAVPVQHERPEEWGWHHEMGKYGRLSLIIPIGFLLAMIVGNHEGQVENIWLVGSAIAMLVVLIWDVRRRKNAWRSR